MYKNMSKEELIKILQNILKTEYDFTFLVDLEKKNLEKLVASIRDRVEEK